MRTIAATVLLLALARGADAQNPVGNSPVSSAERVGESLRHPALQIPPLPPPEATFHTEIDARWPRETPLDAVRRELAADAHGRASRAIAGGGAPTLVQFDVLPAIEGAIHAIREARREHAEVSARREVADDLAQFCVVNDCSGIDGTSTEGVIAP